MGEDSAGLFKDPPPPATDPQGPVTPPLQFTIRSTLALTAGFAVELAILQSIELPWAAVSFIPLTLALVAMWRGQWPAIIGALVVGAISCIVGLAFLMQMNVQTRFLERLVLLAAIGAPVGAGLVVLKKRMYWLALVSIGSGVATLLFALWTSVDFVRNLLDWARV